MEVTRAGSKMEIVEILDRTERSHERAGLTRAGIQVDIARSRKISLVSILLSTVACAIGITSLIMQHQTVSQVRVCLLLITTATRELLIIVLGINAANYFVSGVGCQRSNSKATVWSTTSNAANDFKSQNQLEFLIQSRKCFTHVSCYWFLSDVQKDVYHELTVKVGKLESIIGAAMTKQPLSEGSGAPRPTEDCCNRVRLDIDGTISWKRLWIQIIITFICYSDSKQHILAAWLMICEMSKQQTNDFKNLWRILPKVRRTFGSTQNFWIQQWLNCSQNKGRRQTI